LFLLLRISVAALLGKAYFGAVFMSGRADDIVHRTQCKVGAPL